MRTMMTVSMDDVEAASQTLKSGEMQKIINELFEKIKPEAAYFTLKQGKRTQYIIFNMTDSSNMPYYLEPLFSTLKANIDLTPVMTREDLEEGFKRMTA